MAEPVYTTVEDLREALGVDEEVLPDAEATDLIERAEDLIDERLGNRPIDEATGRKVRLADYDGEEGWRLVKLAKATHEIAMALFRDPDADRRQRVRSVSGDVATSGPYGPAFGERAQALLNQSGLAVPFGRLSRVRSRAEVVARNFFSTEP